jgi:hypothetical protein
VWAEKEFPTMLIASGSFYLQIRFAKVAQAFHFTMDPCRRILVLIMIMTQVLGTYCLHY